VGLLCRGLGLERNEEGASEVAEVGAEAGVVGGPVEEASDGFGSEAAGEFFGGTGQGVGLVGGVHRSESWARGVVGAGPE
jgi:hypothetical protein